jgi:hypothetical protein
MLGAARALSKYRFFLEFRGAGVVADNDRGLAGSGERKEDHIRRAA